jgi:hypothetical protein
MLSDISFSPLHIRFERALIEEEDSKLFLAAVELLISLFLKRSGGLQQSYPSYLKNRNSLPQNW